MFWSQVFKRQVTLSSGCVDKANDAIHWTVIHPVDSIVHLLSHLGQIHLIEPMGIKVTSNLHGATLVNFFIC